MASLFDVAAACAQLSASFRQLSSALRQMDIDTIASHPDLMELDLQLEGFYGQ